MENLKHILDLTYELEGLVELALRRADVQASLRPLISDKIASLSKSAANLERPLPEAPATPVPPAQPTPPTPPAQPTEIPEPQPIAEPVTGVLEQTSIGQLPFSINDKFRFRRELFANDNDRYTQALDIIATMTSFDEVRDYLCNDLELEEDLPEVQAFLERVKNLAKL